jgi:hypothetical protein
MGYANRLGFVLGLTLSIFLTGAGLDAAPNCKVHLADISPLIPPDATVIESGDGYVIYERSGKTRILFDTRKSELSFGFITPHLNNTSESLATINPASGRPVVIEGRHRAVTASYGYKIKKRLGGTTEPFWLNYNFAPANEAYRPNQRLLRRTKIEWDHSVFGSAAKSRQKR